MASDIVFYGGMGSGKSTAADYLVEKHGYERMPIARTLKECAAMIWGNSAMTDREILQPFGIMVREIDEDAWINKYISEIGDREDAAIPVVNDDCRFPNEYWALKERGFVFVRVIAQEEKRVDRLQRNGKISNLDQLEHATEGQLTGLDATKDGIVDDYTIFNNQGLGELYNSVEDVLVTIEDSA